MQFRDSFGKILITKDKPLSHGGEGSIYEIVSNNYPECCVKVFHKNKLTDRINKLKYQVSHPLKAPTDSLYRICWPIDFVYLNNQKVGFIMPLAWPKSFSLYDIYLNDELVVFNRGTSRGIENRYKILFNIANAISVLHRDGYVLVDFKPENILLSSDGKISLIDLDSIQITNKEGVVYHATAFTEDYAFPPEIGRIRNHSAISTRWDSYSFAVVAYQILFGIHPFTVSTAEKDVEGNSIQTRFELMKNRFFPFGSRRTSITTIPAPHYYFYSLDEELKTLFVKTFDLQNDSPDIITWVKALYRIITQKKAILNEFRIRPCYPIVVITNLRIDSDNTIKLEWLSFNCKQIILNGIDYTHLNRCEIEYPKDANIRITATNNFHTNIRNMDFSPYAIFCMNCGNKFNISDIYCCRCGCKRIWG